MKYSKRAQKRKSRVSETLPPYLKTNENKGLFDPQGGLEISQAASTPTGAPAGLSFLSSFGGIDGIISMMGKAQQMFRLFQQIGPLFKMFSFFGGAKALTANVRGPKSRRKSRRRRVN